MRTRLLVSAAMIFASTGGVFAQDRDFSFEDEIIVTAQKRAQSLQEVPLAVSAFDGDYLEITGAVDVQALSRLAPSLNFGDSVNSRSRANFIRGLGTQSLSDGVETGVGTFVDGVIMGRDFQGFGNFSDTERVEVLRGPQGTLFGKNTSAGVIQIIMRDAELDSFSGRVSASYASDDEITLNGMLNVPIVADTAALRISAYQTEHDGFVENPVLGRDVNENDGRGVRAKLLIEPSDALSFRINADWQETDELCCDFTPRVAPLPAATNPAPFLTLGGALALAGQDLSRIGENSRVSFANTPTGEETENLGISGQIDYDFGSTRFVSITAYREGDIFEFNGADYSPLTVLDVASTDSSTEQFSQELRLESTDAGSALQYVVGLYYFDQTVDSVQRFDGVDLVTFGLASAGVVPAPPLPPQNQLTLHGADYENWAVFGQATYSLTDAFRLTAGLRYTKDEVSGYVDRTSSILLNSPAVGLIPIFGNGSFEAETDADRVTGRFIAEYDLAPDVMIFASYAEGYKGPAIQVDPLFRAGATLPVVEPELPTSIEAGLRSRFADGRVTFNLTAFRTDVDNYQAAAFDPQALSFLLQNVGEAETQGLEIEASIRPLPGLQFSAQATILDAEIASFPGASCYTGQTVAQGCVNGQQSLDGADLPYAPDLATYIAADYLFDVSERITGAAHVGLSYTGETQFSLNNNPDTVQDAYSLVDANLRLTLDDAYSIDLFAQNLFDVDYAAFIGNAPVYSSFFGDPSVSQIPTRGRVLGARLTAEF